METVLTVTAPLSAEIEPKQQIVDYGRPANFKCNYQGNPIKIISWMKDGVDLGHSEPTLRINSVTKASRGMYQCIVRNDGESAQATSELKLGGRFDPPEFVTTFETMTTKPGPFISLPCVAKGDPAPSITWYVYGKELERSEGAVTIDSYRTTNGDVHSHLNIRYVACKVCKKQKNCEPPDLFRDYKPDLQDPKVSVWARFSLMFLNPNNFFQSELKLF